MTSSVPLASIRIVLSRTSHPGNIGATARAMKTMGLSQLWLVAPLSYPDPVALARASGADDILTQARVVPTLAEALQGTRMAAALTARPREWSTPPASARQAAPELIDIARDGEIALVFGNETSGLTNEELALCARPVTIPTNSGYSSLNLAAAVQLLCYELRLAAAQDPAPRSAGKSQLPASFEEIEGFYQHLEKAMTRSGFYDPANPRRLMPRIRRLFGRTHLERDEVNILRGILNALERKLD